MKEFMIYVIIQTNTGGCIHYLQSKIQDTEKSSGDLP